MSRFGYVFLLLGLLPAAAGATNVLSSIKPIQLTRSDFDLRYRHRLHPILCRAAPGRCNITGHHIVSYDNTTIVWFAGIKPNTSHSQFRHHRTYWDYGCMAACSTFHVGTQSV